VGGSIHCFYRKFKLLCLLADNLFMRWFIIIAIGAGQAAICSTKGSAAATLRTGEIHRFTMFFGVGGGRFVNNYAINGGLGWYKARGWEWLYHKLDYNQK